MNMPHASWANCYDLAYTLSFGSFYDELTDATIEVIKQELTLPATIIDFGSGTGRLSIPLAGCGYDVLAVEPCYEMLEQLEAKARKYNLMIKSFCQRMQDFQTDHPVDMALCVFTVLLYLLDRKSLKQAMQSANHALKPGGLLLIDIPGSYIFHGYEINSDQINRQVQVNRVHGNLYQYEEKTTIRTGNRDFPYHYRFPIRYWKPEIVLSVLSSCGFSCKKDMSREFSASGSQYLLMEKIGSTTNSLTK